MDWTVGISGLVFLVVLFSMLGIAGHHQSQKKKKEWGDRLHGRSQMHGSQGNKQTEQGLAYLKGNFLKVLERLGQASKPKDQLESSRIRQSLVTAGYRSPQAPIVFMGSKSVFSVVVGRRVFNLWPGTH